MAFFISPTPALFPSEAAPPISRTRETGLGGGGETRSIRYIAHIGWVGKITHHEDHFKACIKHRQWTCKETTRVSPGFTWENDYTYNT